MKTAALQNNITNRPSSAQPFFSTGNKENFFAAKHTENNQFFQPKEQHAEQKKIETDNRISLSAPDEKTNDVAPVSKTFKHSSNVIQRQDDETNPSPSYLNMRNPRRLPLRSPWLDTQANSAYYSLLPSFLGLATKDLGAKYPGLNASAGYRWLEFLPQLALLGEYMTYSHESGHYRVMKELGGDPEINMSFWSGITTPHYPRNTDITGQENMAALTAGVDQETINAGNIGTDWALRGDITYQDAMAYLLAKSNLPAYGLLSTLRKHNALWFKPKDEDDLKNYSNGTGWSAESIFALSALTNLASAPAWAALFGQGRFLGSGKRDVSMPTIKLGGMELTWPDFQLLLASQGPILGGSTVLNPQGKYPLSVSVDTSLEEPGVALGVKAHQIPLLSHYLRISPFLRATLAKNPGIFAGTDIDVDLTPGLGVYGSIGYRKNDLLSEPEGKRNEGLEGSVGLTLTY